MNPAIFSQIVTILGILGCVAGAVQEAYGSQSHWGIVAGVIVTVLGKVGAILAAGQATKVTMQEAEHDHQLDVIAAAPPKDPVIVPPVSAAKAETVAVPTVQPPTK